MNSLLHHCYKRGTDYVRLKPDLQSGKFFFQYLVRPSLLMGFNTESYEANFLSEKYTAYCDNAMNSVKKRES